MCQNIHSVAWEGDSPSSLSWVHSTQSFVSGRRKLTEKSFLHQLEWTKRTNKRQGNKWSCWASTYSFYIVYDLCAGENFLLLEAKYKYAYYEIYVLTCDIVDWNYRTLTTKHIQNLFQQLWFVMINTLCIFRNRIFVIILYKL